MILIKMSGLNTTTARPGAYWRRKECWLIFQVAVSVSVVKKFN